ncbi:ImmA/IrrE family metallo-endopeptidase [Clostridium senegalense]|uniref:ImmA/IrrE family metallo-endopeptidase n=1 Tax=Clostridium senegalense TaxID=1465809 RepID=UPI001C11BEC4|nr:ImmA/IrrE family metallo-endopeptidase [Clostridium senegalense]MBU5227802.1 ImmA/IrrE family metallo-endopeptidase [Clostridium senegalense]
MRSNIKREVQNLIKKYNTNNPFEISEKLEIWIYEVDLGNVTAHYIYEKRKKVFFINQNLTCNEKMFACAHELGHAVLHSKHNKYFNISCTLFNNEKHEIQANAFAAELLIDDDLIYNYKNYSLETISKCEDIHPLFLELKFNK